ncbi:MAG: NAD(P)H-dependent oxidoreductase subunit E [Clostridiales bacterium]|nr:NAD(P)H-dependent oxidoreductase subunit E [Clostridiales bacterium]
MRLLKEIIQEILESYPAEQRFSLPAMQDMQRRLGYVPREGLEATSARLGRPLSALYAMASFYKALSLKPKGKYVIRLCDGTACHLKGEPLLLSSLRGELGIGAGETTADGLFSLETVNCLGSCSIAPAMMIGDKYYGKVTPGSLSALIASYRKEAAG